MSEQLPESVTNNLTVKQNTSNGLLVAESRAYNSYDTHPHPLDPLVAPEPVAPEAEEVKKTHGIIYKDTELGGKPFTIAETYPGSNHVGEEIERDEQKQLNPGSQPKLHNPADSGTKYFNDDPDEEQPDRDKRTEEQKRVDEEELGYLIYEFTSSRNEYARRSAGRGRRANLLRRKDYEYSEESIAEARKSYEDAEKRLAAQEMLIAKESGVAQDDLKNEAAAAAAESEWSLATALYQHRLVATGRAEFGRAGKFQMIEPKTPFGKIANKFYDWWGKQDGKKGMLKKAAATAGIGVVAGIPTALAGTILLGPIAGGAVGAAAASRISKSWMSSRISRRSNRKHVGDLDNALQQDIIDPSKDKIGTVVDAQTENEVKNSRQRLAAMVGTAALGGLAGAALGAAGLDHLFGGHGGSHAPANTHPSHPNHSGAQHPNLHPHKQSHNSAHHPNHPKGESKSSTHTVSGKNAQGEYVWTVYTHAEGLHPGSNNLEHAARLAHQARALSIIHPNPNDPGHFFYRTADGHEDTDSVLKVLAKFGGKVKVR